MLEFSDAPYQFFPARPSRPVIFLGRQVNRGCVLRNRRHRIDDFVLGGAAETLAEERKQGARHLFVFNHPSHSDPQTVTEIQRRLGVPGCFMAAYDVFLRSRRQAWLMQRLGNFSIDRESGDRRAMAAALDVLKEGRFALNIFPEGNVYLTNDRVTPFLEGASFIALKSAKSLDRPVKVVPVSLKFTQLGDHRHLLLARRDDLAAAAGYPLDRARPAVESVVDLGLHLLRERLSHHEEIGELPPPGGEDVHRSLEQIVESLVSDLERELDLSPGEDGTLADRVRQARSKIHQLRASEADSSGGSEDAETHPGSRTESSNDSPALALLANRAILAFRLLAYQTPYLAERPTVDRFAETVERLAEDYHSHPLRPVGPRRAIVEIHPSLDAADCLEEGGGQLREAINRLTRRMESTIQHGIDRINGRNDAPGAERM